MIDKNVFLFILILSRRQRAKNRQQKLLAEIAQSQKKFISQQNPDEHSMLVGTPPSLTNDQFSIEQTITTASASYMSIPTENPVDYECCVCRITKSDSESPIGLIGTSCVSLCMNKLKEKKKKVLMYFILVPSLEFAQLDGHEQNILSFNSNRITRETFLHLTKQSLIQISGHPVSKMKNKVFIIIIIYFML